MDNENSKNICFSTEFPLSLFCIQFENLMFVVRVRVERLGRSYVFEISENQNSNKIFITMGKWEGGRGEEIVVSG